MPYIATDLDAFDSAQGVAGATALPLQHVLGGLALLWRWCWRQKTDAVTGDQLAAHFGSTAPGLATALVAFGFLEARGNAYRVRGAARYLHIAAVRSAAGKKRAAGAKRGARGQLLTSTSPAHAGEPASTSPAAHQHATSPSATSDERRATSRQKSLAGSAAAAPRPGWKELIDRLTTTYQRLQGAKYDFRGDSAKALAAMVDRGVEHTTIEAAWERALGRQGFPLVRTLPELDKHLNHFLGDARGAPAGDLRKGIARAEDFDHLHGPPGEHEF